MRAMRGLSRRRLLGCALAALAVGATRPTAVRAQSAPLTLTVHKDPT